MNPNLLRAISTSYKNESFFSKLAPNFSEQNYRKRSHQVLENFFYLALSRIEVKVLLECGAHDAYASKMACNLGLSAIAIEANPLTFKSKTIKSKSFGVDAINIGLGSKKSNLEFYLPVENKEAGNATFQKKSDEIYETLCVDVTTIDNIVNEKGIADKRLALWIDVEGFAREVLLGATETLGSEHCALINIEVESYPYFAGQALVTEIDEILSSFDFVPILTDAEDRRQFNVVYVKKDFLNEVSDELRSSWTELKYVNIPLRSWLKFFFKSTKLFFKKIVTNLIGKLLS